MDDAAVVAGLVLCDPLLLLEHEHRTGMPQQELTGDREAEDAGPDDDDVGRPIEGFKGGAQGRRV